MKKLPGILLCFSVALPAWFLGRAVPLVGGPVAAILAGILITLIFPNLFKIEFFNGISFNDGVKYSSKKLLPYSIILLGFNMNLFNILRVGGGSLFVLFFVFVTVFVVILCTARMFKLPGNTTVLIGTGTAICGGSAIAAVAPVIRAGDEDISRAISTVFLFNIIAVLIFPALGRLAGMSDADFGIWAGAAINDTSSVVAAGTIWSSYAGENTALTVATIVKLTRTLMIIPITLALAFYTTKKLQNNETGNFSFVKVFPWFILFFVAAAITNTFFGIPAELTSVLVQIGKFGIVMALAAIGLNTNLKQLFSSGIKPIVLGGLCWLAVVLVSFAVLRYIPLS